MQKKLIVLGGFIAIGGIAMLVRFFLFDSPAKVGRLKVLSSPTAGIMINDVVEGKTPFETKLKPGDYRIKLIPEGKDSQSIAWSGQVVIHANALTYVSREMGTTELTSAGEVLTITKMKDAPQKNTGQVSVTTEPTGAIVFLDGDEKGVAPIVLDAVSEGDHELSVYLPGFFRRSQKINVEKGYVVNAAMKIALDKTYKTLEQEVDLKKKEASESALITPQISQKPPTYTPPPSSTKEESSGKKIVVIGDTPTGFLNVRKEPSTLGEKITQVKPGETFTYAEIKSGWVKIVLKDKSEGWVSRQYVTVE